MTNTGDVDLHATITSTLPAGVTPSGVLTWTPTITTPGGVWTQTVVVTVEMGYAGPLTNVVEVTTKECFTSTQIVSLVRSLRATQRSEPGSVYPGETLTFTLAVTNTGNVDLHATITDVLPLHVTPTGVLTWTQVTIQPGHVWTQTVAVVVETGYSGPLTNTVQVTTQEGVADTSTGTVMLEWWRLYFPLMTRMFY